jgi:DNA repair/transcription protein MET18/MMS19
LEESFFDQIACYFPINFKPPKNDTHKITPVQLQDMLSKCMTATAKTIYLFIPFLLDKLSGK